MEHRRIGRPTLFVDHVPAQLAQRFSISLKFGTAWFRGKSQVTDTMDAIRGLRVHAERYAEERAADNCDDVSSTSRWRCEALSLVRDRGSIRSHISGESF